MRTREEHRKLVLELTEEFIKTNPINLILDSGGSYTFCLGHLCFNCTINAKCNVYLDHEPPRISPEELDVLKEKYPELFI